jgi:hypothetical protein
MGFRTILARSACTSPFHVVAAYFPIQKSSQSGETARFDIQACLWRRLHAKPGRHVGGLAWPKRRAGASTMGCLACCKAACTNAFPQKSRKSSRAAGAAGGAAPRSHLPFCLCCSCCRGLSTRVPRSLRIHRLLRPAATSARWQVPASAESDFDAWLASQTAMHATRRNRCTLSLSDTVVCATQSHVHHTKTILHDCAQLIF